MKKKHYLTIIDLSLGETHIYPYDPNYLDKAYNGDMEEYITAKLDHKLGQISWMVTEKLILQIHEK